MRLNYPTIKPGELSNEQNIANIKSFLYELTDQVNYALNTQDTKIEELEAKIEEYGNKGSE